MRSQRAVPRKIPTSSSSGSLSSGSSHVFSLSSSSSSSASALLLPPLQLPTGAPLSVGEEGRAGSEEQSGEAASAAGVLAAGVVSAGVPFGADAYFGSSLNSPQFL